MKLKVYLAEQNMTLNEFSDLLNINRCYMSRIMNGRIAPGWRLAKDVEELTGGVVKLRPHFIEGKTQQQEPQ